MASVFVIIMSMPVVVVIVMVVIVMVIVVGSTVNHLGLGFDHDVLALLGCAYAIAKLTRPRDGVLVGRRAARRGGAHPAGAEFVITGSPVFPRKLLWHAIVVDDEFFFGVDRIVTIGEGELEQL